MLIEWRRAPTKRLLFAPVYSVVSVTKEKKYVNYRLKTSTTFIFNQYRQIFYIYENEKYKKIIPTTISEMICSIVLAHVIMGDGTFGIKDSRIRIYTNSFSFQECNILADAIKIKPSGRS